MINPHPGDPTPETGSPTDIAPVGRATKPPHEQTADEDPDVIDWDRLAATEEFRDLLRRKARFIIPATVFFIIYYFALPILVGFAPHFMETKVWGRVNLAYLFALSQFFVAWILAWLYVRAAGRFDEIARSVLSTTSRKEDR